MLAGRPHRSWTSSPTRRMRGPGRGSCRTGRSRAETSSSSATRATPRATSSSGSSRPAETSSNSAPSSSGRRRSRGTEPYAVHRDATTYGPDAPPALARRDSFGPVGRPGGAVFRDGRQPGRLAGLALLGAGPAANLEGRAVCVLWSWTPADRPFSGRGAALRRALDTALHFLGRTRWDRTLPGGPVRTLPPAQEELDMRRTRESRGEGAFGLVVGLAVLFVVVVALVRIVPLHIHGNESSTR